MKLFVALSFLALAVLYWAASGGAGFEPEAWPEQAAEAVAATTQAEDAPDEAPDDALAASLPVATDPSPAPGPEAPPTPLPAAPEGLPADPLDPDAALAALAPDLAAEPPEAAPDAPPEGPLREVTGDVVNVRAGPGTDFDVVGQLARGERAEVLELRDGWASVRAGATEGWMSERFLAAP